MTPFRDCRVCGLHAEGMASLRQRFCRHSQSRFGFNGLCIECNRRLSLAYGRAHPQEARKRAKRHRESRHARLAEIQAAAGGTKRCTVCHVEKPADRRHFYSDSSGKFGFCGKCKSCFSAKQADYAERNRGAVAARQKQWHEQNRDRCAMKAKQRYQRIMQDPAKRKAMIDRANEYQRQHPDARRRSQRRYHDTHPASRATSSWLANHVTARKTTRRWRSSWCIGLANQKSPDSVAHSARAGAAGRSALKRAPVGRDRWHGWC